VHILAVYICTIYMLYIVELLVLYLTLVRVSVIWTAPPQYVGCYSDAADRALPIGFNSNRMTIEICIGYCILRGKLCISSIKYI